MMAKKIEQIAERMTFGVVFASVLCALVWGCGEGEISRNVYPFNVDAGDEDSGYEEASDEGDVGLMVAELKSSKAECNVQKMHEASRKFFLDRAPSGTVCTGKVTDQRWYCKHNGSGRTWSVFAYDVTTITVTRSVQGSQMSEFRYVCDYSASCQLSCRRIIGTVII